MLNESENDIFCSCANKLNNEDRLKIQSWTNSSEQHLNEYCLKPRFHCRSVQSILTFPAKSFCIDTLVALIRDIKIVGKIIELIVITVMDNLALAELSA